MWARVAGYSQGLSHWVSLGATAQVMTSTTSEVVTISRLVNAFFRWKNLSDAKDKVDMSLFLLAPSELKTRFDIPKSASADVSLRRIQHLPVKPGTSIAWTFGAATGVIKADAEGVITIPRLTISAEPTTLTITAGR